jgi:Uma2 family endonuclease
MALPQAARRLTEREYLEIERRAEIKSEFYDGEMFAMSGGTRAHSAIAVNLIRELGNKLKGRPCSVYNSDLRVKIEASGLFTYPDVSVVCGAERLQDDDILLNPVLLAEVLSESTEAYDRGKKFEHYRQIPSLREYLLISQAEPRIEQFIRQETGDWLLREAAGTAGALELPSLQIPLELGEVFARIAFTPAPIRPANPRRN